MTVTFYNMSSAKNSINKLKTQTKQVSCQMYEDCSITDPVLIVKNDANIIGANYVYIGEFERYYFITNITITDGNRLVITCHVDVLETYWNDIKTSRQHVVRNQYRYNLYMRDPALQITTRPKRKVVAMTKDIPYPFLTSPVNNGHNFVLNAI